MIEVFKTNVDNPLIARVMTDAIQAAFPSYAANFDLDDCDRILRVKSVSGDIDVGKLIAFVGSHGFRAEVLPDDQPFMVV